MVKWTHDADSAQTPYGPVHLQIFRDWEDNETFVLRLAINDTWVNNPYLDRSAIFRVPDNVCHEYTEKRGFETIDQARLASYTVLRQLTEDERYALDLADNKEMTDKWAGF